MPSDRTRTTVAIRQETHDTIRRIAAKDHRTVAEVINMLLRLGTFVYLADEQGNKITITTTDGKHAEVIIV